MNIFSDVQTLKFRAFHSSPEPVSRQVVVCLTMSALPTFETGLNLLSRIGPEAARILAADLLRAAELVDPQPVAGPELRIVSGGAEDDEDDALSVN